MAVIFIDMIKYKTDRRLCYGVLHVYIVSLWLCHRPKNTNYMALGCMRQALAGLLIVEIKHQKEQKILFCYQSLASNVAWFY